MLKCFVTISLVILILSLPSRSAGESMKVLRCTEPNLRNSADPSPGIILKTLLCSPYVSFVWQPTRFQAAPSAVSLLS